MENTPSENPVSEKYRALKIDGAPVIEKKELLDHKQLLKDYFEKHGKPLKPVNRRSKHLPPPNTAVSYTHLDVYKRQIQ